MNSLHSFPLLDLELDLEFDTNDQWKYFYTNPMFGVESVKDVEIQPKKAGRVPSKYNVFFKETIAQLKVDMPDISHMERVKLVGQLWKQKKDEEN